MSLIRRRILVVEDDPTMTEMLTLLLEDSGCNILTATSGEEALELAQDGPPPDLITLDLGLPGMDGSDLLRLLRSNPVTMDVPVIVVTARHFESTEGDKVAAVLNKPFDASELESAVYKVLGLTPGAV